MVASLTSGTATSVTNTVWGSGVVNDVVSVRNTVLGTSAGVVDGVSGTRSTLCGAGVDEALVRLIKPGCRSDVIGFSLLGMFK